MKDAGFTVAETFAVPDQEFSFDGPARPDVLTAWRERFARMPLLVSSCGGEFGQVRDEFLACLARPDHRSVATVRFCLATRSAP